MQTTTQTVALFLKFLFSCAACSRILLLSSAYNEYVMIQFIWFCQIKKKKNHRSLLLIKACRMAFDEL